MKNLALAALLMGATGLLACGGDDDGDGVRLADAAPVVDGAPTTAACNPVTQQGCDQGEKCAWLEVSADPYLAKNACVPDGTVANGGSCMTGEAGETTGYDNCVAGNHCIYQTCRQICSMTPDSCPQAESRCGRFVDLFDENNDNNTGVCANLCDPLAQDCPNVMITSSTGAELDYIQGCTFRAFDGAATCSAVPNMSDNPSMEYVPLDADQGDECLNFMMMQCYSNGCTKGFYPILAHDSVPALSKCAAYCGGAEEIYLIDPEGTGMGELSDDTDPAGVGVTCASPTGGSPTETYQCRPFKNAYVDENMMTPTDYPEGLGFCAPVSEYGDCTQYSLEHILKIYDDAETAMAGTGEAAADAFCTENPDKCATFCASRDTVNGIIDAYCTANPTVPNCVETTFRDKLRERTAYDGLERGLPLFAK